MESFESFSQEYFAGWPDMDFNQHMRNASYLGYAENTRFRYLEANGWTIGEFLRLNIGPVVLEDRLTYRREIKLLERFEVDITLAAATESGSRMKLRNTFRVTVEEEAKTAGVVESHILWLDLATRKPITPPYGLRKVFMSLPRTEDFTEWGER